MPIRRLRLGQMRVAIENQMPNARSRDVSENSLHISSLRVSLHLAKPSVWKNSRGQGNIRSKLGYALSYGTSGTRSVRGCECLFTNIQPRNPQWIKSRRLSMAHTPCLGRFLPVFPPPLLLTASLCPGNLGAHQWVPVPGQAPLCEQFILSSASTFCVCLSVSRTIFSPKVLGENLSHALFLASGVARGPWLASACTFLPPSPQGYLLWMCLHLSFLFL